MASQRKQKKRLNITDLRRVPAGKFVNIDSIGYSSDDFIDDPVFHELYINFLLGKNTAAMTRISLSRITPGFLGGGQNQNLEFVSEPIDNRMVDILALEIKAGRRSQLFLYKSRVSSDYDFFCPDDANMYAAYKGVGITKVPVVLLDYDLHDLEESALCISYPNSKDSHYVITDFIPSVRDDGKVKMYFGMNARHEIDDVAHKLENIVEDTSKHLRLFHIKSKGKIHYNHMVASILFRLRQSLRAISLLSKEKLTDQVIIQLRAIYELSLNHYIDWLAPEAIGPYAQLFSIVSRKDWENMRKKFYEENRNNEWSEVQIREIQKSDNRLYDLLTKVSEKAKLNPLRSKHKDLYSFLSRFAHQDFYITARHAHTLTLPEELRDDPKFIKYVTLYMDIIITQIISNINSDLGDVESVE